jgi:hypothetical protein
VPAIIAFGRAVLRGHLELLKIKFPDRKDVAEAIDGMLKGYTPDTNFSRVYQATFDETVDVVKVYTQCPNICLNYHLHI